ncbi:MAG: hypothetical protein M1401_13170 [Chloroflexi bacterium]|nr:hypothetical protein [Chloroflexota bacterium]
MMRSPAAFPSFGREVALGLQAAVRRWPLALALYLPNLVLGLLSALPIFLAGEALGQLGPWTARLAEGDLANTLIEFSALRQASPPAELRAAGGDLVWALLLLALGVLAQGTAYNLLAGAVLGRLAGDDDVTFGSAFRRWAGPMFWFGFLALMVVLLAGTLGVVLVALLPVDGSASLLVKPLLGLGWFALLNGWLEVARASMVARSDPRALRALGRAITLPGRVWLPAIVLWLLLGLVGALYLGLGGSLAVAVPGALALLAVAVQQLVAFAGAWLKLARLGIALGVARATAGPNLATSSASRRYTARF